MFAIKSKNGQFITSLKERVSLSAFKKTTPDKSADLSGVICLIIRLGVTILLNRLLVGLLRFIEHIEEVIVGHVNLGVMVNVPFICGGA
jgi:hypothetical protein